MLPLSLVFVSTGVCCPVDSKSMESDLRAFTPGQGVGHNHYAAFGVGHTLHELLGLVRRRRNNENPAGGKFRHVWYELLLNLRLCLKDQLRLGDGDWLK